MRFLLAIPIFCFHRPSSSLVFITSVTNDYEHSDPLRLEHPRDHRFSSKFGTHCLTNGLPWHAPLSADEECVLRITPRVIAVATRLLVSLLGKQPSALKQAWPESVSIKLKRTSPCFLFSQVSRSGIRR